MSFVFSYFFCARYHALGTSRDLGTLRRQMQGGKSRAEDDIYYGGLRRD